jgi:hypothetical protein
VRIGGGRLLVKFAIADVCVFDLGKLGLEGGNVLGGEGVDVVELLEAVGEAHEALVDWIEALFDAAGSTPQLDELVGVRQKRG